MTPTEEHGFRSAFPVESYPQFYDKNTASSSQGWKPEIKQEVRWIADIVAWRLRTAFNV